MTVPKAWTQRFARKTIAKPNGCIEWTGHLSPAGYGQAAHEGKKVRAHRLSWAIVNGPIPDGMFVCHRCDNRACVNPDHLFLGSPKDNTQDMLQKGRSMWSRPEVRRRRAGAGNPNSKLTSEQVREIRQLVAEGETQLSVAGRFGVGQTTVGAIVRGERYVDHAR